MAGTTCNGSDTTGAQLNSAIPVTDIVRFDEHENPAIAPTSPVSGPTTPPGVFTFPETGTYSTANTSYFPTYPSGSPAGGSAGRPAVRRGSCSRRWP